jgi:hypothetical protein
MTTRGGAMLTKTSAAKPDPGESIPAKINPINLLRMVSPFFPTSDLSANHCWSVRMLTGSELALPIGSFCPITAPGVPLQGV